ncbi:MAG: ribonuclease HII [Gammaproteobacteria bacterium]
MQAVPALAGVDEAGRGPLAGPVMAAAVILDPDRPIPGLDDSKKLTQAARERLAVCIERDARAFAVAQASSDEIDELNILQASLLAMRRAVEALGVVPDLALVDGNRCPDLTCRTFAVVRGDGRVEAIGAASIVAKVARDEHMRALHRRYPQYEFERHKGYPTAAHRAAIARHGVCPEHRRSFAPVRDAIAARAAAPAGT